MLIELLEYPGEKTSPKVKCLEIEVSLVLKKEKDPRFRISSL